MGAIANFVFGSINRWSDPYLIMASICRQASSSELRLLDTTQTLAPRIATGAFRNSSALSLWADASIPPLHFRCLTLITKLLTSILQPPGIPAFNHFFNSHSDLKTIFPIFKYHNLSPIIPAILPPRLFEPPEFTKVSTPPSVHWLFRRIINRYLLWKIQNVQKRLSKMRYAVCVCVNVYVRVCVHMGKRWQRIVTIGFGAFRHESESVMSYLWRQ